VHLLEEEPEKQGRWKRFGGGAAIAAVIAVGMTYGANHFEPTRRLIQKVVEITVAPEPPKNLPPPRTEPPPPPPKRAPPQKTKVASPENQAKPKPADGEQTVGLDSESFGEGSGGPSFQVGNTQMGEPERVVVAPKKEEPKVAAIRKMEQARALDFKQPEYPRRARQLGIEGLVVLEIEVDEDGKLVKVRIRQGLDDELDRVTMEAAKTALYEPARLDGQAIASTRLLRVRYQLEN
jgi:protein TonB